MTGEKDLHRLLQNPWLRRIAALLITALGLWTLLQVALAGGHHHHA